MSNGLRRCITLLVLFSGCLVLVACASPVVKMPHVLPEIVKAYKSVTVPGSWSGMEESGVVVEKGDTFTILAKGEILVWPEKSRYRGPSSALTYRIGRDEWYRRWYGQPVLEASAAGAIFLGFEDGPLDPDGSAQHPEYYRDNQGVFVVDLILWKREDPVQQGQVMQDLLQKDPQNLQVASVVTYFKGRREIRLAEQQATQDVAATQQALATLTQTTAPPTPDTPGTPPAPPGPEPEKERQIAELTARLQRAQQTLQELEALKQQLATQQVREQELTTQLARLQADPTRSGAGPPVIAVATPADGASLEVDTVLVAGVAEHPAGLTRLDLLVNGEAVGRRDQRDVRVEGKAPRRIEFTERLRLREGANAVVIAAHGGDGQVAQKTLTVEYRKKRMRVWAVVVGINKYRYLPPLKYAVNDAREIYRYLVEVNHVPPEQIWLLLDEEATLDRLRSVLGTQLRRQADREDTVLVFLAGHGATERDAASPDGDGLEKYLLPVNADPKDLYATALPMHEVARVFQRINAERLVFLADTCYSGASGGRTVPVTGTRATLSGAFLDRLSQGKGRVLLTASDANEVSTEQDALQHGVFTYYLLEALRGKGDVDGDGVLTVDEVYRYVATTVPQATGQEQHPVKKGEVTGQIVLGVVGDPHGRAR